tara:strand:- start:187 stop:525 length:339 start_codon:yes stop_codon:yes gene_type:complete
MNDTDYCVAIIKPKQPFLDWINRLSGPPKEMKLEDIREDCTTLLIPEFGGNDKALKYVLSKFEELFIQQLEGWDNEDEFWPTNRTKKMFLEWFDVEIHSMVFDLTYDDSSIH